MSNDKFNKSFRFSFGNLIITFWSVSISHLPDLKKYKFLILENLKFDFFTEFNKLKKEVLS